MNNIQRSHMVYAAKWTAMAVGTGTFLSASITILVLAILATKGRIPSQALGYTAIVLGSAGALGLTVAIAVAVVGVKIKSRDPAETLMVLLGKGSGVALGCVLGALALALFSYPGIAGALGKVTAQKLIVNNVSINPRIIATMIVCTVSAVGLTAIMLGVIGVDLFRKCGSWYSD